MNITVEDIRILFRLASNAPLFPEQREWIQAKYQIFEESIKASQQTQQHLNGSAPEELKETT